MHLAMQPAAVAQASSSAAEHKGDCEELNGTLVAPAVPVVESRTALQPSSVQKHPELADKKVCANFQGE
eukprot:2308303-Amphidinium_carterae.2